MLTHESRQFPSWIIFDVGQRSMRAARILLVMLIGVALAVWLCVRSQRESAPAATDPLPAQVAPVTVPSDATRSAGVTKASSPEVTQRIYTREEAKEYLDSLVAQITPKGALPELDFRPEDSASADEKARIIGLRQDAARRGKLLIVARSKDGVFHASESGGDFPRDFVPENIRTNLTEEDWQVFQVSMEVAKLLAHGFGRSTSTEAKVLNKTRQL